MRNSLLAEYPLPEGTEPIPDDVLLDPKWLLEFADKSNAAPPNDDTIPQTNDEVTELPSSDLLDIPGGLTANITSNDRVTPTTHWQDVRHLVLDVEGVHPYVP